MGADAAAPSRAPDAPHEGALSRRATLAGLVGITLLGALLRLVWLDRVPAGLFFDVAANLFDVLDIRDGRHAIWFPRNNGREPLMLYLQAATSLIWGPSPLAAKVAAAILGIPAIPATYLLAREAAARSGDGAARRIGLIGAYLMATLYWHVHFSRLGLRTIALPLFLALGAALLLRALRRESATTALWAGGAIGLAMYTYTASRLLPLALLPPLAVAALRHRGRLVPAAVVVATWLIVTLPLGVYYISHPGEMSARTAAVSVLNPEVGGGDPVGAAARGLVSTFGATVVRGANSALENLPDRPLFEPLSGVAFLVGLAVALFALVRAHPIGRIEALLLLGTMLAMALSPALSVNPPGFVRISGMIPPIVVLASLGYGLAWRALRWRTLAALALVVPLASTSYDYFVAWAPSDAAFRGTMADKVEGSALVSGWVERGERVFLAPLYARDFTYRYLLRDVRVDSFDIGTSLVTPGERQVARYAFPPDDRDGLALVAERLGKGSVAVEVVPDQTGQRALLATLRREPQPGSPGAVVRLEDGIGLAESRVRVDGRRVELELEWAATALPRRDYTVFVHGRDGAGQTRFQRDRMPGLATTQWRLGDRIRDYYTLEAPPGDYRLIVGMYLADGGTRLTRTDDAGHANEIEVATIRVAA